MHGPTFPPDGSARPVHLPFTNLPSVRRTGKRVRLTRSGLNSLFLNKFGYPGFGDLFFVVEDINWVWWYLYFLGNSSIKWTILCVEN